MATLELKGISKDLGGKRVVDDLNLHVRSGELVCLLGASGCGKTTTLRMIGGFTTPDAGSILLDDVEINTLPPERRPTAMVFQQYALWPHMTVFQNIAFGLQLRKLPQAEVRERVERILALVQLGDYARAYTPQLSGGQQQRVALARALVLEPKLLLLDEPLSNLDAKLRIQVREDIREIQRRVGITTVFVTHDQDEASAIADRVGVMKDGRLEQFDTPAKIYREPATLSVASFVGAMNLLRGRVSERGVIVDGVEVPCAQVSARPEGEVDIAVRLEDVDLSGAGGPRAQVTQAVPRGHFQEIHMRAPWGEIRAFAGNDVVISPEPSIAFRRALLYRDGHLLDDARDRLSANLA